jgi:gliding motility-associated-like protein
MGKDYYSINYKQTPTTAFSVFCVVATEDNTSVEITPAAKLSGGSAANTKFTISLQKGQTYQGLSSTDLTGTRIKSVSNGAEPCKKIAVYSGSSWVAITCTPGKTSADNLFQQVYPTSSWGKNFITAPLANRGYDIFRIIYSDPTAVVQLNGNTIPAAQVINGFYYEFSSTTPNVITSDKPIQVVQYAVTQGSSINCGSITETAGDPEMIFLNPIEQGLDHVTLYSTDKQNITQSYINVVIPSSAVSSFILDGASYSNFKTVPGNTAYSYAQIPVASGTVSGTHNISAASPFNAIAYGFGNVESYGYAAGTDLKNLNEFIELEDPSTNSTLAQGCAGVTYKPQLSIPYQTTKITWDLKDGTTPLVVNNPTLKGTVIKGTQTLYVYEYPNTITYTTAGSYSIIATVLNPTSDDCGSNEDIEFDYTISDIPGAKFTAVVSTCPGAEVTFTDATDTKGVSTKTWAWNFGDAANATAANPNTVATQNAKHTFIKPGDYTVGLTITNTNGCVTTFTQAIHINALPVASFTTSTPDCETRDVTFTDTTTPGDGTNAKWVWDFGDGSAAVTKPDKSPFTYQYPTAKTYHVTLTVTSSTGCISDVFTKDVVISPLPVVDFVVPDVCTSDTFAQFTSKTSIADGSENQFTYSWNFGDATATVQNANTSTLANPTHAYHTPGNYQVSLTVTSKNGCAVTKQQTFTVNGDTPKAAFIVENSANLCSSDDVIFQDKSTVNFGSVTKIVWYFDYINHPNDATVYTKDQFPADGRFHHNYGLFYTPASLNYAVKMEAYSGQSCVNVAAVQTITVKANPFVTLSQIGSICQDASPVPITQTVKNGVAGTGTFSGTGVSATGLFDPAKAGPGTYTINYTFIAANSCDYTTSQQVTVFATPTVNGGGDLHLLQGGQVTINATATGNAPLTYKWTMANGAAAVGLNHDNVLTPAASPADDVTYMLTVTSANGCSASATVNITVLKSPVVPNTFTPNNDGTNDTWDIKYLDSYPNCTVEIYNRLGEKLYSSIGYPTPWDGSYKGGQLPVGTYYYIINPKNGRKVISGSVTIIR